MPAALQSGSTFISLALSLALGGDIHALGRLVNDQNASFDRQPFAEENLLLIAATQPCDRLADTGSANSATIAPPRLPCAYTSNG